MQTRNKINVLIGVCVTTAILLIYLQYYLVNHTYEQTKTQYTKEIKESAYQIINQHDGLQNQIIIEFSKKVLTLADHQKTPDKLLNLLIHQSDSLTLKFNHEINKQFRQDVKLKNVRHLVRFNKFVIEYNGARYERKGTENETKTADNQIKLMSFGGNFSISDKEGGLTVSFYGMHYADVSGWKTELYKRMSVIFIAATILIITVSLLFYLTFSAIFRQKKITAIQTDFVNNMTHELKTPLSSVSIILKSLKKPEIYKDTKLVDELIASLERQHHKIQHIIDDVLESAILTQQKAPVKSQIDIVKKLREYISDRPLDKHQFQATIQPEQLQVFTHWPSLEKALDNLLENATKYSDQGSTIKLTTYVENTLFIIEVIDEGKGIKKAYQSLIFDKFFRIPEENRHNTKGLGLGLYISRQTLRQIGSELILTKSNDNGSIFQIQLPVNEN